MSIDRRQIAPLVLGVATLAAVVALFVQDAAPQRFPARSHEFLAAFSLAMIALAYLIFQWVRRSGFKEMAKTILLAGAFLFWAANQFWSRLPEAELFNDIAIGLFVLDLFLVMVGWPASSHESVFSAGAANTACPCQEGCCCGDRNRDTANGSFEAMGARSSSRSTRRV